MKGIIRNRARNWKRRSHASALEERGHPVQPCDPWREAALHRLWAELPEVIAMVPSGQRSALIGRHFGEKTAVEIARSEEVSPEAVRQRLARVRTRLRPLLSGYSWLV